jgi:phage-related protein
VTVSPWTVETLDGSVDSELADLPADMRARFVRIASLIEVFGLSGVGMPHVRHVDGPLWEMRLSGRTGIARALYVAVHERRVVVVRVFVKKTQRTPSSEVALATERAKRLLS